MDLLFQIVIEKIRYGSGSSPNLNTDPDPGIHDSDPDSGKCDGRILRIRIRNSDVHSKRFWSHSHKRGYLQLKVIAKMLRSKNVICFVSGSDHKKFKFKNGQDSCKFCGSCPTVTFLTDLIVAKPVPFWPAPTLSAKAVLMCVKSQNFGTSGSSRKSPAPSSSGSAPLRN